MYQEDSDQRDPVHPNPSSIESSVPAISFRRIPSDLRILSRQSQIRNATDRFWEFEGEENRQVGTLWFGSESFFLLDQQWTF